MQDLGGSAQRHLLELADVNQTTHSIAHKVSISWAKRRLHTAHTPIVTFTIDVRVPRYRPSFSAQKLTVNEDALDRTLIFARDLNSGVPGNFQQDVLRLRWKLVASQENTVAFRSLPEFRTRLVQGQLVGTVTFGPSLDTHGNFSIDMLLLDPAEIDPELNESFVAPFLLEIKSANDPPKGISPHSQFPHSSQMEVDEFPAHRAKSSQSSPTLR